MYKLAEVNGHTNVFGTKTAKGTINITYMKQKQNSLGKQEKEREMILRSRG
jgi:hypothetical protein